MRTVSSRSVRRVGAADVILVDSITQTEPGDAGHIVISGSHGGTSAAFFAAQVPARLYAFNDAGIGKDRAGIAGLDLLESHGIAAVAVSHDSAAIGDAADTLDNGVMTAANGAARLLGAETGLALAVLVLALAEATQPED
ncbi:MAG: hypothetical protein KDJ74_14520 [Notoacmeibacter sp.]|nr:hypothetical protein [Notoacmeibacter sp.]